MSPTEGRKWDCTISVGMQTNQTGAGEIVELLETGGASHKIQPRFGICLLSVTVQTEREHLSSSTHHYRWCWWWWSLTGWEKSIEMKKSSRRTLDSGSIRSDEVEDWAMMGKVFGRHFPVFYFQSIPGVLGKYWYKFIWYWNSCGGLFTQLSKVFFCLWNLFQVSCLIGGRAIYTSSV